MKTKFKNIKIIFLLCLCTVSFFACHKSGEENSQNKEEQTHEEKDPNQVEITEAQYKTVGIQVGGFEKRNLKNTLSANGVLEVPPQNKAFVSSYIGGLIKSILVFQGDYVKKGQTLGTIEHPDILQLQQDYVKAKSDLTYLEKDFARQKELLNEDVVAAKKYQQVEAEYKSQKGLVQSLEGKLHLVGISPEAAINGKFVSSIAIRSPINGYVNTISVSTGSAVDPATQIFEVIDNSFVHVDLQIYEKDLAKVKTGQKVYFTLANTDGEPLEATIFAEGKSFENNTKSSTIHAEIKKNTRKDLKPGMYVNGRIELGSETVNALPDDAIAAEGDLKYIFIKVESKHHEGDKEVHTNEEGKNLKEEQHNNHKKDADKHEHEEAAYTFERIEIRTGISDQGYTEIILLHELPANTEIVTAGAYYLAAQLKKSQGGGEEEGHGH